MQISSDLVLHIAELSKLNLDKSSQEKMKTELQSVVEYMDILNKLDTENVEPLSHIVDITNVLREDEVVPSYPREDVLKNAPARTDSNFVVPKTVE